MLIVFMKTSNVGYIRSVLQFFLRESPLGNLVQNTCTYGFSQNGQILTKLLQKNHAHYHVFRGTFAVFEVFLPSVTCFEEVN
jgi:hypothetical protein